MPGRPPFGAVVLAVACTFSGTARAQAITYRGFVEAHATVFPQDTGADTDNVVTDVLGRGEVFARVWPWLQVAAGMDVRANSHDQVENAWRPDVDDRGTRRPRVSIRRLSATVHRGPFTLDVGKQFIRWGKTDILTPTDRFAPRDYLNVIDADVLAIRGVRAAVEKGAHTIDTAWVPFLTPSRLPLLNPRWTPVPAGVELIASTDPDAIPRGSQAGVRWGYTAGGFESSMSFYDGFNHLPTIEIPRFSHVVAPAAPVVVDVTRTFPQLRMYGGDAAAATRWFTAKGEVAYFTSSTPATDEYVLYVVQLERQTGEWVFVGGYAGEVVTERRLSLTFAPDRGTARTILGRASYTIDVNRSAALEGAVRQNGDGLYVKGEYSQARGQHWRATIAGALIRGEPDDFLGQYRLNSHAGATLRYSF